MPVVPRMIERIASFSRLIMWDKRGTGCSDPVVGVPAVEERMEDLRAVMDAAGAHQAALWGVSEGGPMSLLFAATYPERTRALILYGTTPKFTADEGWRAGWSPDAARSWLAEVDDAWGEGALLESFAPTAADDEGTRQVWSRFQRAGASPAMARAVLQALIELDVRAVLPSVRVPTLILHRRGDRIAHIDAARYMAESIPGARLVELAGADHLPFVGDVDRILDEVEEFLTGTRGTRRLDRILATVLFTDIVRSTEHAARLGDRRWREVLLRHDALVLRELTRFRGHLIKGMGDGMIATFDGPARAIECACAIRDAVTTELGLNVRAGLHTGECEMIGDDIGGMAVHIGARVGAEAGADEVLVSRTVRDLVVGSGIEFREHGEKELKGVPGRWHLYAVAGVREPAAA